MLMMNVNVRETMPTSPTEDAWQSLKDDSILKVLPFLAPAVTYGIPAAFGTVGAFTGAGGQFTDDEGNFDLNFGGNAVLQDPFTAGLAAEKELGDSKKERALGATVGLTQANPMAVVGKVGRGLQLGAKGLQAARAGKAVKLGDAVMDTQRAAHIARMNQKAMNEAVLANTTRANAPLAAGNVRLPIAATPQPYSMTPRSMQPVKLTGNHPAAGNIVRPSRYAAGAPTGPEGTKMIEAASAAERNALYGKPTVAGLATNKLRNVPQRAIGSSGKVLQGVGGSKFARGVTRALQGMGQIEQHLGPNPSALFGYGASHLLPDDFLQEAGPMQFGGEGGTGGDLGMGTGGGYGEESGFGMEDDFIYDPSKAELEGGASKRFVGGSEFKTGENMKIGERMLKEAKDAMYAQDMAKGSCPNCGDKMAKTGCMKMGCGGMEKADKKPAHGMVIVIGSKAGPGPSKDGKREKVDSEKKD